MASVIVFRRRRVHRGVNAPTAFTSPHVSETLHRIQFEEGTGCTARFCDDSKAALDECQRIVNDEDYPELRVKDVRFLQGQWVLILAAYQNNANEEHWVTSSQAQWNADNEWRLHLLESGGGETFGVWRTTGAPDAMVVACVLASEIESLEEYRIARVVFDQSIRQWVTYYDTTATEYGEWVQTGTSADGLQQSILQMYVHARKAGENWYVVSLSCNTKREWVAVCRESADITKECVLVLKGAKPEDLSTSIADLLKKDPRYMLRYVAYDGVDAIIIAQVRLTSGYVLGHILSTMIPSIERSNLELWVKHAPFFRVEVHGQPRCHVVRFNWKTTKQCCKRSLVQ
eukprot:8306417-Pyramimonas_sp.AAC.1